MNKEQISRRFYWTKRTFVIFVVFLFVASAIEALGMSGPLELELLMVALLVISFIAFAIAFGSFARSLEESATSWIATVVFIPVIGLLLAYLHLGQKYKSAMGQGQ